MPRNSRWARSLFGSFILIAGNQAAIAAVDPALEVGVDAIFAEWNRDDSPGCAATVVKEGRQVYRKGFGMASLELGVPISAETVFNIASVSKQFTATAIALLAEEGAVSLDDDVRKYVPELPYYGQPIKISHLVHHTSGLRDYLRVKVYAAGQTTITEDQALQFLARQKSINFTPGSAFQYNNSNYLLMSIIVKRASGLNLREYADAHIFKPLGMHHTKFYDNSREMVPNRAVAHTVSNDASSGWVVYHGSNHVLPVAVGSGGLLTTIDDLARWERNFLDNRLGKGGQRLIHQLTTSDVPDDDGENGGRYGFGLHISSYRGLPTVSHGGADVYRANMLRFPEQKVGIFVLCNAVRAEPGEISEKIADIYLSDHLSGPKPESVKEDIAYKKLSISKLSDKQLDQMAGRYYSEEIDAIYYLIPLDGGIEVKVSENVSYGLALNGTEAYGVNSESMSENGRRLRFNQGNDGEISGFLLDMLFYSSEKPPIARGIEFRKF